MNRRIAVLHQTSGGSLGSPAEVPVDFSRGTCSAGRILAEPCGFSRGLSRSTNPFARCNV
jgi:hypothetical protein